jgi:carbamoyl-phosphate synthase large subunit
VSPLSKFDLKPWDNNPYTAVKEAVLPFNKFPEESIFLSPEMKSTGEVMGISETLGESFRRALISAGNRIPVNGNVFISVNEKDKLDIIPIARDLAEIGFHIIATSGTKKELQKNGIRASSVFKAGEGRPNIVDEIKNDNVQLVINTPYGCASKI